MRKGTEKVEKTQKRAVTEGRKKPKKRKNSREKGARAEREVAQILKNYGFSARRGQQYSGGSDSPDVFVEGFRGKFHLEVKRTESFQLEKSLKQARSDSGEGEVPVVVHRKNNNDWVAVLDFELFLTLIKELEGRRELGDLY